MVLIVSQEVSESQALVTPWKRIGPEVLDALTCRNDDSAIWKHKAFSSHAEWRNFLMSLRLVNRHWRTAIDDRIDQLAVILDASLFPDWKSDGVLPTAKSGRYYEVGHSGLTFYTEENADVPTPDMDIGHAMRGISSKFSSLKSLKFYYGRASQHSWDALTGLNRLTSLQSLAFRGSCINMGYLHHILVLTSIKNLVIEARCDEEERLAFHAVGSLTQLRSLRITRLYRSECWYEREPCEELAFSDDDLYSLSNLQFVRSLDLEAPAAISDRGMEALGTLTKLTHLGIKNLDFSYEEKYPCSKSLQNLRQRYSELRKRGEWQSIIQAMLARESASDHVTCAGIISLSCLFNLSGLSLGGTILNSTSIKGLPALARLPKLTSLQLSNSWDFTDDDFVMVAHLTRLKDLNMANLFGVTGSGIEHLSELTDLTHIQISGPGFQDSGVQHLTALRALASLSIDHCVRFTAAGMQNLAAMSSLTALQLRQSIGVAVRDIKDENLLCLLDIPKLRHLTLGGSCFTNTCAQYLVMLGGLTKLTLSRTSLRNSYDFLAHCMPNCDVVCEHEKEALVCQLEGNVFFDECIIDDVDMSDLGTPRSRTRS